MTSIGNKAVYARHGGNNYAPPQPGLTFREVLIVAAVQGLCVNYATRSIGVNGIADLAIEQADAVIAALDKEQKK